MEPLGYLRLLRRRWRLILLCGVAAAVAVFIVTPTRSEGATVTWVAEATLVRDGANAPGLASVQLTMRTGAVPQRVAPRVGYTDNPLKLARTISFEVDDAVGTLQVGGSGSSPQAAADVANAFAAETILFLGEQAAEARVLELSTLETKVTQIQTQLADLDRQIRAATAAGGSLTLLEAQQSALQAQYGAAFSQLQSAATTPVPSAGLRVLETAQADLATVQGGGFSAPRSRPVRTAIGLLVGLLCGVGLVLVLERFDPRLVTREEIEAAYALPIIATVPDEPLLRGRVEVFTMTEPASAVAEGYRSLRAALLLMPTHVLRQATLPGAVGRPGVDSADEYDDDEPEVVIVTSAAPGDGKSSTVANLAVSLAESGRSVLVLGCDFRKPSVHRYFGIGGPGVMDFLRDPGAGEADLRELMQATAVPGVSLIPHGTGAEDFGDVAARGRVLLNAARTLADVVVVDTPPMLVTNDAVELIPSADTTVIVCRSNKTTRDAARRSRDLLERLGATVSGIVIIGADDPESRGYGGYYRYRTGRGRGQRSPLPLPAGD